MAKSPSHILGELIGNFFENAMKKPIEKFSVENDLYFDTIGYRKARKGIKVTWEDADGNHHDLDYVLERGGTEANIGLPVAFIELAWRRYTKHSKNKAQEISGAINPIVERFKKTQPFKGAILSGEFTSNSLEQLRSQGFSVLYISFNDLVSSFRAKGLDIFFDEDTSSEELSRIVDNWKATPDSVLAEIRDNLLRRCATKINTFIEELSVSVNRRIESIHILPLHGSSILLSSVDSAIKYINDYESIPQEAELQYIEIIVRYTNGSHIDCHFKNKQQTIDFLSKID